MKTVRCCMTKCNLMKVSAEMCMRSAVNVSRGMNMCMACCNPEQGMCGMPACTYGIQTVE